MIYKNETSRNIMINLKIATEADSWTHIWNNGGPITGHSIANDSSDNIYVLGCSGQGGCLVKYNNSGELISYQTLNLKNTCPQNMKIDSSDNIYISGELDNNSMFLYKYDNAGNPEWNHSWGLDCWFGGMALDSSDNIYLTYLTTYSGSGDICIVKYNSTGDQILYLTGLFNQFEIIGSIKVDSQKNIFLSKINLLDQKAIIIKFNSLGIQLWNFTVNNDSESMNFAIDSNDNIICAIDTTLFKLNNDGIQLWNQSLQERSLFTPPIITDSLNNIYIATNRNKKVIDNLLFVFCSCIETAIYIEKYNSTGNLLWEKRCTGCNNAQGYEMAIDSQGNLYLCGSIWYGIPNLLIMKNPSEFTGECIEIYYDLIILIIVGSIIASITVIIVFIRKIVIKRRNKIFSV